MENTEVIELNEPWYSAYKFYGWAPGTSGMSVAEHVIKDCIMKRKELIVKCQGKTYQIDPAKALVVGKKYLAKTMPLRVIPITEFQIL